jgi:hypothetical protein
MDSFIQHILLYKYVFLDVLLKQQTVTYVNIRGLDVVAAIRREEKEKTDFSIEQFQKYENGEISIFGELAHRCGGYPA